MSKNVEELRKIIDQFERDIEKIREAAAKEVRRARTILRKISKQEK